MKLSLKSVAIFVLSGIIVYFLITLILAKIEFDNTLSELDEISNNLETEQQLASFLALSVINNLNEGKDSEAMASLMKVAKKYQKHVSEIPPSELTEHQQKFITLFHKVLSGNTSSTNTGI